MNHFEAHTKVKELILEKKLNKLDSFLEKNKILLSEEHNYFIQYTCELGNIEVLKILFKYIEIFRHHDFDIGYNKAASFGYLDILKYIDEHYILSPKLYKPLALKAAIKSNQLNVVNYLLEQKLSLCDSKHKEPFLKYALDNDYLDIAHSLYEKANINISTYSVTALQSACKNNDMNFLKYLISNNIDLTIDSNIAIYTACFYNNYDMVKYLLSFDRISLDDNNCRCLNIITKKGYDELFDLLIKDSRFSPTVEAFLNAYRLLNLEMCEVLFKFEDIQKKVQEIKPHIYDSYKKLLLQTAIETF